MRRTTGQIAVLGMVLAALTSGAVAGGRFAPGVLLGPSDNLAIDQPTVQIAVEDPVTGQLLESEWFNSALLDTGANGVLLTRGGGFFPEYELALRADGSPVIYDELGVAGTMPLNVFQPYNLYFAGVDGTTRQLPSINILGTDQMLFEAGIVGMPAMAGRATTLDLSAMVGPNMRIATSFSPQAPAATSHSYHIALEMLPPEPSGQQLPTDPLPTFAALPLVNGVSACDGIHETTRTMLLDTGAQVSIISTGMAVELGIDPATDAIGSMTVGGVGGTVEAPMVQVDRLSLPTVEGWDLTLTDLQVLVLDIPGLGGVLGMETLTSGWTDPVLEAFLGGAAEGTGYFEKVVLDFTGDAGVLRVDVAAAYDNPVLPGDADGDRDVDAADLVILQTYLGQSQTTVAEGDFDGDGDTDLDDLVIWNGNRGVSLGEAVVPEPVTLAWMLAAAGAMLLRRRR